MNLPRSGHARLLRTTAFRLALRYALGYALLLGLTLAAWEWASNHNAGAELQEDLQREFSFLVASHENAGATGLVLAISHRQSAGLESGRFYLLVASNGSKIAGNLLAWPQETDLDLDGEVHNTWVEPVVIPGELYDDDAYLPVIGTTLSDGSRLLLSRNVEQAKGLYDIAEYLMEFSVAVLLALLMSVALGRAILIRMDTISRTAGEIMAGDLTRRMPVSNKHDEFDALAGRLNMMLDRIGQLIKGIREVTDLIAHDLRSPLTRLRNRLEITLLESRSEDEYRQALNAGISDAESLIKTFNSLLEITQAEAGHSRGLWESLDMGVLANDLVELYEGVAEERGQVLELQSNPRAHITGIRDLLAQALGNLLENAIKFTPAGGLIRLQVRRLADVVEVSVSDTGPGIPESEREHVLERFVRLETSRHTPGNGLGLSLVQAVSRLHKAELLLGDAGPGLVVTLRFNHV